MAKEHDTNGDGWEAWSRWVRLGIERLEQQTKEQQEAINQIRIDLAVIKTKVALWGFIGAAVAAGIVNLIFSLVRLRS